MYSGHRLFVHPVQLLQVRRHRSTYCRRISAPESGRVDGSDVRWSTLPAEIASPADLAGGGPWWRQLGESGGWGRPTPKESEKGLLSRL